LTPGALAYGRHVFRCQGRHLPFSNLLRNHFGDERGLIAVRAGDQGCKFLASLPRY